MPTVIGKDQAAAKRVTCRGCGSINEYYEGEVRNLRRGTDYGGGPDGADGFNCACCGKEIITRSW